MSDTSTPTPAPVVPDDFEMYTDRANRAVAQMVGELYARIDAGTLKRSELLDAIRAGVAQVQRVHAEIWDTEPQWAITDAVNHKCRAEGWLPIDRWDI